ncbi:bifunctional protein-disulfide isomerase/oxidoreductase DsbC [Pseudomonas sp. LRF_L74]|uniref:bifunctional protein-disulfide isomerase/oxidoreductase DsbC n=1 Tax=Pseudomonas sp. LRF_L74 TaxID=3369422 RepID=UPI003F640251
MRVTRFLAGAAIALASLFAQADQNAEQNIRKTLESLQAGVPVESISSSPLNGLYEVQLQGGRVLYASADGKFVIQGYLYQVDGDKVTNLTEATESRSVAKLINGIPAAEMVVYPAKGEAKTHITVFTDTTCPYCHKLHGEVAELNTRGIEVRYLAFPRQGLGSEGDKQMQAVWCAKDRVAAMDKFVEGSKIEAAKCDNPVAKQFQLGQAIGVNGTPAIVLADGKLLPGYQPAAQLAAQALMAK